MSRTLMSKVDILSYQMSNVSREIETLRRGPKKLLENKSTITAMKNVCDGHIREKRVGKKQNRPSRAVEQFQTI